MYIYIMRLKSIGPSVLSPFPFFVLPVISCLVRPPGFCVPPCLYPSVAAFAHRPSGPLGGIVLGPDHHLHRLEGLPVVGGVVLRGHVVPGAPEDAVAHTLVTLVVVLAIEVGRHAGVKPPARAIIGAAVAGGVMVVVAVGSGEELLVVVKVLIKADGVSSRAAVTVNGKLAFYFKRIPAF